MSATTVPQEKLQHWAAEVLHAGGMLADSADEVARVLVWADLRGTGSHGVSRLPLYLQWLKSGEMQGQAQPKVTLKLPSLVSIDGQCGPGAIGMRSLTEAVASGAKRSGVCLGLLKATTHTGGLGYYTSQMAEQGFLALAMAASGPLMAYFGAASNGVSTAPLSIAAPAGKGMAPIVFDMASSATAFGKLMQAKAAGQSIPADWALDAQGQPTTDATKATTLLPVGGPKGSGLALMAEIMCSLLSHNPLLAPALALPEAERKHQQNALLLAIDIAQITQLSTFEEEVQQLAHALKQLTPMPGSRILMPGERGAQEAQQRSQNGITLGANTIQMLDRVATQFAVTPPWA